MPKEAPLVSQYLERISRGAVEKYLPLFETYVVRRQGVYALYRKDKLYYVGLASNLKSRLHQHLKDHHGKSWDRFSVYFTVGDKRLKELETLILHITGKPRGNKNKGKFKDSENLKRTLKRDIKTYQRRELMDLIGQDFKTDLVKISKNGKIGREPILADYIGRFRIPLKLRAIFKGRKFRARVRRDGSIRFRKKTYNSPSAAGIAACRHSCDGWYFWRYERAPGDWVKLNELRK
jgi:Restriction Enzyme Adenine Methylase Associated/GIY-YIG catalytic domain